MLVLSRKLGERIIIDEQIVVEVVRCRGDKVRLGITAPPHVQIRREELPPRPQAAPLSPFAERLADVPQAVPV